ncbi:putative Ubiquitin domain-containing protein [Arabidopsis thaliana]
MQVFIINEDGKKYCVEVEKTTTIADMKTKIYDATGMENAYQYLEHRGKIVLEVHGEPPWMTTKSKPVTFSI